MRFEIADDAKLVSPCCRARRQTQIGAFMAETLEQASRHWYRSPLAYILLVSNALCFAVCVALLMFKGANGPLVALTIGTGLMAAAGLAGSICASRHPPAV